MGPRGWKGESQHPARLPNGPLRLSSCSSAAEGCFLAIMPHKAPKFLIYRNSDIINNNCHFKPLSVG